MRGEDDVLHAYSAWKPTYGGDIRWSSLCGSYGGDTSRNGECLTCKQLVEALLAK